MRLRGERDLRAGRRLLLPFDQLGWELRAVVSCRRDEFVLRRLVLVLSVLSSVADLLDGVDRPDPWVQLAACTVADPELGLAFPRWHLLPLFLPRPYGGMQRLIRGGVLLRSARSVSPPCRSPCLVPTGGRLARRGLVSGTCGCWTAEDLFHEAPHRLAYRYVLI